MLIPCSLSPVAALALQLQQQEKLGLSIEVPVEQSLKQADLLPGCRLIGNLLEFESLAERNQIIARAAFDELSVSSSTDPDRLFDFGYKLWRHEIGQSDQASGRLLALAAEDIDIVAVAARRIRSGIPAFDVLHLLEAAFPYLTKLSVESVVDLCIAKHEQTKNDMMGGAFHGVLETWLRTRLSVAKELHEKVTFDLSDATASLLGNAVFAMAQTDFRAAVELAMGDTKSRNGLQARIGAWTLGRLVLDEQAPPDQVDELVNELKLLVESGDGELRSQAIRSAVGAMYKIRAFDTLLEELARSGDQEVLCAAASTVFYHAEEMREGGTTRRWLEFLTALKPEFAGAVRDYDYALAREVAVPEGAEFVIKAITQWVTNYGEMSAIGSNTAELFDDTIRTLFGHKEYCARLVTRWLLSDGIEHPAALAGIFSKIFHDSHSELELDKGRIDQLTTSDLMFLARRLLGYVHDRAQLTSLSLSLLNSKDAQSRIYPIVRALMVDEIGYDYPGNTVKALRQNAAVRTATGDKEFLLQLVDTIDRMIQVENALPTRSELRPPEKLRRLFARARAKQMNDSFEEASKRSVFRQFATEIPIKAGSGTFNYQNSNYGTSMKLSSISHSIELPRRESFDPIGNAIRHFGFRTVKRDAS